MTIVRSFFLIIGFFVLAIGWGRFAGTRHKQYQKITQYVQAQADQNSVVHRMGPAGIAPQFIVFFVHGFLGFNEFSGQDSWNEFVHKVIPGLSGMSYFAYHPGLIQTKDVQTFSQECDVYQAGLHLKQLVARVQARGNEARLGGHLIEGLPILCVGHSNGGATLLSLFSQHKRLAEQVKGAVLLAPYADLSAVSTLAKIGRWLGSWFARIGMSLFYAPSYNPFGSSPLQLVESGAYPSQLPTLIVSNRNDRIVFFKNRELLAQAFATQKKYATTVQFLDLQTGGHNWGWKRVSVPSSQHVDKKNRNKKAVVRLTGKHRKYLTYLRGVDRMKLRHAMAIFIKKYIVGE